MDFIKCYLAYSSPQIFIYFLIDKICCTYANIFWNPVVFSKSFKMLFSQLRLKNKCFLSDKLFFMVNNAAISLAHFVEYKIWTIWQFSSNSPSHKLNQVIQNFFALIQNDFFPKNWRISEKKKFWLKINTSICIKRAFRKTN